MILGFILPLPSPLHAAGFSLRTFPRSMTVGSRLLKRHNIARYFTRTGEHAFVGPDQKFVFLVFFYPSPLPANCMSLGTFPRSMMIAPCLLKRSNIPRHLTQIGAHAFAGLDRGSFAINVRRTNLSHPTKRPRRKRYQNENVSPFFANLMTPHLEKTRPLGNH